MMYGNRLYGLPGGNILQQNSAGLSVYDHKKNSIADFLAYYPALKEFDVMLKRSRHIFFFITDHKVLLVNTDKNSFDIIVR